MRYVVIASLLFVCGFAFAAAPKFQLTSPDMQAGKPLGAAQVANTFGCTGGNASPALEWKNLPPGTKSLAVTAYDPDAPTGSGWWHWLVYDIPATATGIPAGVGGKGALPEGAKQGRNDCGIGDYCGACPPPGDKPHHYVFTVHALKVDRLPVPPEASAAMIGFMLNANSLGKATLVPVYSR